jgi:hypothetical protein
MTHWRGVIAPSQAIFETWSRAHRGSAALPADGIDRASSFPIPGHCPWTGLLMDLPNGQKTMLNQLDSDIASDWHTACSIERQQPLELANSPWTDPAPT